MTLASVSIFLGVQVFFTLGDLTSIWVESGRPDWREFRRRHLAPALAIAFFWVLFFAVQNAGLSLIPGLSSTLEALRSALGLGTHEPAALSAAEAIQTALLFVASFFVVTFWDYLAHRFVLHHKYFWFLHEYHHLPRRVFNGMPGISVRPFVFATTLMTYGASLATLYVPLRFWVGPSVTWMFLSMLPLLILALTLILSLNHSHLARRFPAVHEFLKWTTIATPQEHIYHHSISHEGNYGNFSTLWDRVFGTYITPDFNAKPFEPLGLKYDQDFLGTLTFGKVKVPQSLREKFALSRFCPSGAVE